MLDNSIKYFRLICRKIVNVFFNVIFLIKNLHDINCVCVCEKYIRIFQNTVVSHFEKINYSPIIYMLCGVFCEKIRQCNSYCILVQRHKMSIGKMILKVLLSRVKYISVTVDDVFLFYSVVWYFTTQSVGTVLPYEKKKSVCRKIVSRIVVLGCY